MQMKDSKKEGRGSSKSSLTGTRAENDHGAQQLEAKSCPRWNDEPRRNVEPRKLTSYLL
jgi:hypothetical protein